MIVAVMTRIASLEQQLLLFCRVAIVFAGIVASLAPACAQTAQTNSVSPERELIVGTKDAPPFSMKAADGSWQGISIELWRHIADENHLKYRITEVGTVQDLLDGVAAGRIDVAVAALTPTAERERAVEFTQPFYTSGLGVAVPIAGLSGWYPVLRAMTSFGFVEAIAALVGLAVVAGILIWLFERRGNESFGGGVTKGLSSGILWSASTMTQRHTGEFNPQSVPGRIVAIFWMAASIIVIAAFTAGVTSALTTRQLRGNVHNTGDLSSIRVGVIAGTSGDSTLTQRRIAHRGFASLDDGLKALKSGEIDALVHDKPLLAWAIKKDFSSSLELVDATIGPQSYAFAVPEGASLRKSLDISTLDATSSDWWDGVIFQYLGARP